MAENNPYGIAAPLTEALEAAVFADTSAANKAYDMIEHYAYGEEDDYLTMNNQNVGTSMKTLAMAEFVFYDSDNQAHKVSIPKITMMPIPLLHVTEASFDMEMSAHIVEPETTEVSNMDQKTRFGGILHKPTVPIHMQEIYGKLDGWIKDHPQINLTDHVIGTILTPTELKDYQEFKKTEQVKEFQDTFYRPSIADYTHKVLEVGASTTPGEKESTINMKVKIEMKQAELPEGIKLLLQSAAHSLQVAATEIYK